MESFTVNPSPANHNMAPNQISSGAKSSRPAVGGRGQVSAYGFAVTATVLTLLVRLCCSEWIPDNRPMFILFLLPIILGAYAGGLGPGLAATVLAGITADYYLIPPYGHFGFARLADFVQWGVFLGVGVMISGLSESLHRARNRANERQREHAVTLASIGDAVITTDTGGRIRFLNREAERLTGWSHDEAVGHSLALVFRIINEQTRQPVEDPVEKVLRTGSTAGLANHTVLVARDGRETAIDDTAAPIRHGDGRITGVVLVFRDNTEKKRAEDLLRTQAALLRETGGLARLGGWDFDPATGEGHMTDEVYAIHDLEPGTPITKEKGLEFYPGEARKIIEAAVKAAETHGTPYDLELEFVSAKGVRKWVRTTCHPVMEDGRVKRVRGTFQDITDRRTELEQAARERARFKLIFDSVPIGIAFNTAHPDGTVERDINDAHLRICGLTREMHDAPEGYRNATHPDDRLAQDRLMEQVTAGLTDHFSMEKRYVRQDGSLAWVHFTFKRATYADGTVEDLTTVTDITARKLEAEQVARERARFKLIFDTIPIGIAFNTTHPDGTIERDINDAHLRICGFTREMHDQPDAYLKISHYNDRAKQRELQQQVLAGRIKEFSMEKRYLRNDGTLVWVLFTYKHETYADGTVEDLTTVTDITARKLEAEQVARERARFKLIFDTIPIGIAFNTTRPDGTVERDINDAHLRICGFTRAMHDEPDSYLKLTFPDDRARQAELHQQLMTGQIRQFSMEKRYLRNDGTLVWVIFALKREIYPDGTVEDLTTVVDITERRRMEEQLRQSSKMEAIGLLAGGVAHDFNNILAIIQIQIGLLAGDGALSASQTNLVNEMSKAAERAANLTRQLLLFSRKQTLQLRDLDLNDTVASVAKMLQRAIGEDVHLQLDFAAKPLFIHADPGMMDQILVNLAVNARDAMPHGGNMAIELSAVNYDDKNPPPDPRGRPGAFVCIQVSDTGTGIPPENLPQIFDPFFTTKDVSKGTGLGLATVYGIVQQHQGWITVESELGHGTKFRIFLPRLAQGRPASAPAAGAGAARGGHETILVVEDEAELRRLVKRILNHLGYQVFDAGDGKDALEIWRRQRDNIQLLLTDLVLPDGVSGKDIAREMLAQKPGLKVVYASGYSADAAGPDLALQEGVNFLAKPYLAHKLAEIVRNRLDLD